MTTGLNGVDFLSPTVERINGAIPMPQPSWDGRDFITAHFDDMADRPIFDGEKIIRTSYQEREVARARRAEIMDICSVFGHPARPRKENKDLFMRQHPLRDEWERLNVFLGDVWMNNGV